MTALVMVPYAVRIRTETVAALQDARVSWLPVDTSGPDGYWHELSSWWAAGQTFIVVEQDKVPGPGVLEDLWACGRPWCSVPVAMRGGDVAAPYPSLSCTKFGAALIARHPGLLENVGELDVGFGEREWSRLDLAISGLLEGRGERCHWHEGVVEHLHDG